MPHGEEEKRREGRSFRWLVVSLRGWLNPQECRRRRDPLSTDRSSTKPYGRSRSGTRTCLQSAPVLTDQCGKQLLQSSTIAQRPSGSHHPTEARQSCLFNGAAYQGGAGGTILVVPFVYIFILAVMNRAHTSCTLRGGSHFFGGWGLFLFLCTFFLLCCFTHSCSVNTCVNQ